MCDILNYFNLIVSILFLMYSFPNAQPHESAGTYPFDFINVNCDAYSVGMGGASVAVPNGANAYFRNPAMLSIHNSSRVYLGYAPVIADMNLLSLALNNSIKNWGTFALSMVNFSSGEIDVIEDNNGVPHATGEVAIGRGQAASLSWSYRFADYFSAGITLRGLFENLATGEENENYHSSAVSFDAGVYYNFLRNRFCVGGVIKNVGYIVHQYDGIHRSLPSGVEIGVSYIPRHMKNIRLAYDISKMFGDYLNMRAGVEAYVYKEYLAFRIGIPSSSQDLVNLGKQDFVKSNINILAIGMGVNPPIPKIKTHFNFALQLKSQGIPPIFLVSNTTEF
jgi:hypothetical protein